MGLGWTLSRGLSLGVMLALALGGCDRRTAEAPPNAAVPEAAVPEAAASTPTDSATAPAEFVDEGGFRSTPIEPARVATLISQSAGAQINLRSQPTTESAARGYGVGGDSITLLRLAEGEGGFSWYYVKFTQSGAEGWVRGDFIDTSGAVAIAPAPAATGTDPAVGTGPCGDSNRPEAFFETESFTIHLCQTPQGLSYIGINRDTQETLTTADVRNNQGTYVAINGNYQYHVNDSGLVVYQVNSGSYTQLDNEAVLRHERFLY